MRLVASVSAGVIVACLIFAILVLPRSNIETMLGYTSTNLPSSPVVVILTISGFTEPRGINSQALLQMNVTSNTNITNAAMRISLSKAYDNWPSKGIAVVGSNVTLNRDLEANVPLIIDAVINTTAVGYGKIIAEVTWCSPASKSDMSSRDSIGILVLEDEVLAFSDAYGGLPFLFPPDSSPVLPNPIDPNQTMPYP